jgi:hypothetical protein
MRPISPSVLLLLLPVRITAFPQQSSTLLPQFARSFDEFSSITAQLSRSLFKSRCPMGAPFGLFRYGHRLLLAEL